MYCNKYNLRSEMKKANSIRSSDKWNYRFERRPFGAPRVRGLDAARLLAIAQETRLFVLRTRQRNSQLRKFRVNAFQLRAEELPGLAQLAVATRGTEF